MDHRDSPTEKPEKAAGAGFACLSPSFYLSMFHQAEGARVIETGADAKDRVRYESFVLASITTSVAFLESFINEVFAWPGRVAHLPVEIVIPGGTLLTALWPDVAKSLPTLKKYELALIAGEKEPFDKGGKLHQNVDALIKLRNAVVHYQTEWRDHSKLITIEKLLAGKFQTSAFVPDEDDVPFFPYRCLSAGCAEWAAASAGDFVAEFDLRFGPTIPYRQLAEHRMAQEDV